MSKMQKNVLFTPRGFRIFFIVIGGFLIFSATDFFGTIEGKIAFLGTIFGSLGITIASSSLSDLTIRKFGFSASDEPNELRGRDFFFTGLYSVLSGSMIAVSFLVFDVDPSRNVYVMAGWVMAILLSLHGLQLVVSSPFVFGWRELIHRPLDRIGLAKPLGALFLILFIIYGIAQSTTKILAMT